MKKLLLINPRGRKSGFLLSRISTFPPLGLAYVAAVTPSHWEVKVADENFEELVYEEADLVGLTAFTSNITRAYEIAQHYRERKIPVILGGIHASVLPDEALNYVDSVVIGEVEGIWEQVISDFEAHRLAPRYVGPRVDLKTATVVPRRDLLNPNYFWTGIQTSRGCPFACHFCSVTGYLGSEYRQRTPDAVLEELAGVSGEYITFLDDNLIGYTPESRARAAQIFKGMIERDLRKKWWMQTSMNAADDESVLALAAQAGCMYAFIGFESIATGTLKGMKKGVNLKAGVDNYSRVIDTFHRYGIAVLGAFIIGNDDEPADYYRELAHFLVEAGVDMVQISILTPVPGTQLMEDLAGQKRLRCTDFPRDWDKYRMSYVVHDIAGSDAETVYNGNNYVKEHIYSFPTYQYRLLRSALTLRRPSSIYATLKLNAAMKKAWLHAHYHTPSTTS